ncbi:MAG: host-nuclease inhibitor Gam family protein [Blastomonas sp.]
MARRKDAALLVPASSEEAAALLAEYRLADRIALEHQLRTQKAIDRLKENLGEQLREIENGQTLRFAALKSWWEAGGKALAGRKRSTEIDGVKIGMRTGKPRLKLPRGMKADAVVAWLKSLRLAGKGRVLRIKETLDKETSIKVLLGKDDPLKTALAEKGLAVVQAEDFFIDTGLDEEAVNKDMPPAS